MAEYVGGAIARRYAHGPGVDEPLIWLEVGQPRRWLIADRQGSIIAATDGSGTATTYAYDPYGVPREWAGPRFMYTGQAALPELQLYHYKARIYDPGLGRFLQTDPISYDADTNLYAYAYNDAVNLADPTGLSSSDCGSRVNDRDAGASSCTAIGGLVGGLAVDPQNSGRLQEIQVRPTTRGQGRSGRAGQARRAPNIVTTEGRLGAHTVERHVARTDAELQARLAYQPSLRGTGTFRDESHAQAAINTVIRHNREAIREWTNNSRIGERQSFNLGGYVSRQSTGRILDRATGRFYEGDGVNVVLTRVMPSIDAPNGFIVHTAYPTSTYLGY